MHQILNHSFSHVKRNVSLIGNTQVMDVVWHQVDKELERRSKTWAWFARQLGETDQVVNNWKRRGVPARQHAAVAQVLGWPMERLLGLSDSEPAVTAPQNLEAAIALLANALENIDDDQRDRVEQRMRTFIQAPDSQRARDALVNELVRPKAASRKAA